MKRHLQKIVINLAVSLGLVAAAPMVFASEQVCTAATLNGAFGYTVTGTINPGAVPALPPGPFAAVGRLSFNGTGGVSTVRTLSANGTVVRADSGAGTYSIRADCTGSFNISIATPGGSVSLNLDFVLDDENRELRAIVTNSGYILTLQGRKQVPSDSSKD